jgi:cell division protein ZapA
MSEVQIHIGGRTFTVACQPGEEKFLIGAAKMLDAEASALVDQLGKMPEAQMLLMSGLMLADKTAALEEQLRAEGIVMPTDYHGVEERLAALAARAEAIADKIGS